MLTFTGQFYVNERHLNFISVSYFAIFLLFYLAEFSVDTLRLAGWMIITSPCTVIESTRDREHTCYFVLEVSRQHSLKMYICTHWSQYIPGSQQNTLSKTRTHV